MVLSPTRRACSTAIRSSKWSSCLFPSHESQAHTIHIQGPPYSHSLYTQPQHKNTLSNAVTHRWHYRVLDIPCHQNRILSSDKNSLLGVLPQAHSILQPFQSSHFKCTHSRQRTHCSSRGTKWSRHGRVYSHSQCTPPYHPSEIVLSVLLCVCGEVVEDGQALRLATGIREGD